MNYLIQGETLTAIADRIRSYTSVVGNSTHIIADEFLSNVNHLAQGAVLVLYYENVDSIDFILDNCDYPDEYDGGANGCDYLQNAEGNTVPVIYLGLNDTEPYFYVGVEIINGMACDKWRKIELTDGDGGEATDEYNYTWTSERKKYIYTNRIVICSNEEDELLSPSDFPTKIDEVYENGYEKGSNNGVALPELTNEGTAADLTLGKQLIDGEGNVVEGTAMTYDEGFGDGYDEGYWDGVSDGNDEGFGEGYHEGERDSVIYNAPLIIQGKNLPSSFGGLGANDTFISKQMYPSALFVNAQPDNTVDFYYYYDGYLDYEVLIDGSTLTVGVNNHSRFFVDTKFKVAINTVSGQGGGIDLLFTIAPYSSTSWGATYDSKLEYGYVFSIDGLRFYTDGD